MYLGIRWFASFHIWKHIFGIAMICTLPYIRVTLPYIWDCDDWHLVHIVDYFQKWSPVEAVRESTGILYMIVSNQVQYPCIWASDDLYPSIYEGIYLGLRWFVPFHILRLYIIQPLLWLYMGIRYFVPFHILRVTLLHIWDCDDWHLSI